MKSISSPVKQILLFAAVLICSWTASTTDVSAGSLEPPAAPAPTMRTLEEQKPAWNKIIPANQRFVDALDGSAVLDKETGLVWTKNADLIGTVDTEFEQHNSSEGAELDGRVIWNYAELYCYGLRHGGKSGWRLPTVDELTSVLDVMGGAHPFTNLTFISYWSSTQSRFNTEMAMYIVYSASGTLKTGAMEVYTGLENKVWCVRGSR